MRVFCTTLLRSFGLCLCCLSLAALAEAQQAVARSGPPLVSEPQASALLLKWIGERNYYAVPKNCVQTSSKGYNGSSSIHFEQLSGI